MSGMNAERLRQLADAYGAEPGRWPAAEREAALALLAEDRRAERLLFEARKLDAALDASPTPAVSPALRERVLAAAGGLGPQPRRRFAGLSPLGWASGLGWAAAAVAGIAIGLSSGQAVTRRMQVEAVLEQASAAAIDDMEILG